MQHIIILFGWNNSGLCMSIPSICSAPFPKVVYFSVKTSYMAISVKKTATITWRYMQSLTGNQVFVKLSSVYVKRTIVPTHKLIEEAWRLCNWLKTLGTVFSPLPEQFTSRCCLPLLWYLLQWHPGMQVPPALEVLGWLTAATKLRADTSRVAAAPGYNFILAMVLSTELLEGDTTNYILCGLAHFWPAATSCECACALKILSRNDHYLLSIIGQIVEGEPGFSTGAVVGVDLQRRSTVSGNGNFALEDRVAH